MALAVAKVNYEIREIELKNKPSAMLEASPKGTVPVLVLQDARVIDESLDIMYWALKQNDPENWLSQDDTIKHSMNELIATNDGSFKFHLDRMKYANRYDGVEPTAHRSEAIKLLASLEARLSAHAYLFSAAPTLADIAIFPFVRQFAHADVESFGALPFPCLQAWLKRWEGSALFQSIMTKHAIWQTDHAKA